MTHQDFLQKAIQLAVDNVKNNQGGPFGAIVVKDGEIVGQGVNRVTTHNDPTAHAEIGAIRDACKNLQHFQLEDCIIYTSCEPCPMCFGAIYWARPKKVYFACTKQEAAKAGFDDQFIYDELAISYEQRKIKMERLSSPEKLSPFQTWMKSSERVEY
ncbi:nucleoside deaminase [Shimazuella sp. AN120528]|uniref:nucleoside deaminase n=1 Tax=Shimazuella soli TaxID=1892854 RepID=UPI001F0CEC95|nr:nucleoside deaminase [Shimazuella soli]MCH5584814.1 nucleoside deaminase [Shimazuella soli]